MFYKNEKKNKIIFFNDLESVNQNLEPKDFLINDIIYKLLNIIKMKIDTYCVFIQNRSFCLIILTNINKIKESRDILDLIIKIFFPIPQSEDREFLKYLTQLVCEISQYLILQQITPFSKKTLNMIILFLDFDLITLVLDLLIIFQPKNFKFLAFIEVFFFENFEKFTFRMKKKIIYIYKINQNYFSFEYSFPKLK